MRRVIDPVDEVPPVGRLVTFGLQHVLAMYAGAVAVPLIFGSTQHMSAADIGYLVNADLLVSGIATLIQCGGIDTGAVELDLIECIHDIAENKFVQLLRSCSKVLWGADAGPNSYCL